ncbi:TetR/AcrR family transcriptional regulator [Ancylobacter sp. SL191]|uniref:TetR/AcrR family transcriptional regulator n=1 Tax=Ancylobacter sp. SL191 TaxID=2995166 RepID=UPI0022709CBA|nr:TetR/AcrR family transcriptional regulator [Ancylobacter sp. SL191]WAC28593.1 TetR/AcrR family transcriptional regulator [Ancylobacter sp. SL191]
MTVAPGQIPVPSAKRPRVKPSLAERPGAPLSELAAAPAKRAPARRPEPRRRVLDAAIICFTRSGFHGTSMQQICAEAGMSPGGLYRYFPSKESIILAIIEEESAARATLIDVLETAPSFVEGIARMGAALFSREAPAVCLELGPEIYAETARNPALKPTFDAVETEMNEAILRCFRVAQAKGEVDADLDADTVMLLLGAIGDGLVLRNRFDPDVPLDRMMPQIAQLIARMLAPRATPTPATDVTP